MNATAGMNDLHQLMLSGRKYTFKKGQVVHSSDERSALTLIKSGFIMRYQITSSGATSIQSIYGAGNFYPLTYAFKLLFNQSLYSGPEIFYYETLADSKLYIIDSEVFLKQVQTNPNLYRDLLQEAGKRFYSNIQRLENISLPNASKRVAHQLLYYAQEFGEPKGPQAIKISLPLTHALLAATLSLTRETVSQSIGELRKLRLIKTDARAIIVPDKIALQEFSYA